MVSVKYVGRTCNNLFQYVFARLIAHYNDARVVTPWSHEDFIAFNEQRPCKEEGLIPIPIDDTFKTPRDPMWLQPGRYKRNHIMVRGYFQYPEFYDPNKELIKSWMRLPEVNGAHKDDTVIHLRLDDYERVTHRPVIDPCWYYQVTQLLPKSKVYCVVDQLRAPWEHAYMNKIRALFPGIEIVSKSAVEDFNFIRQFGTIICSNSSYCWWAAWLSNAKVIYAFSKWLTGSRMVTLAHTKGFTTFPGKYYWD
jgi:hypothetical protein